MLQRTAELLSDVACSDLPAYSRRRRRGLVELWRLGITAGVHVTRLTLMRHNSPVMDEGVSTTDHMGGLLLECPR